MIYEDVGAQGYYSNVAFNGTIEVVEKPKLVDMEGIFMYLMIFGALAGTGAAGSTHWQLGGGRGDTCSVFGTFKPSCACGLRRSIPCMECI